VNMKARLANSLAKLDCRKLLSLLRKLVMLDCSSVRWVSSWDWLGCSLVWLMMHCNWVKLVNSLVRLDCMNSWVMWVRSWVMLGCTNNQVMWVKSSDWLDCKLANCRELEGWLASIVATFHLANSLDCLKARIHHTSSHPVIDQANCKVRMLHRPLVNKSHDKIDCRTPVLVCLVPCRYRCDTMLHTLHQ